MKSSSSIKMIVATVSIILAAISGYSLAADLTGTTSPTGGTQLLQPLIQPKPAGDALSITRPPITSISAPSGQLNTRPHRTSSPGTVGATIVNERFDQFPLCPPDATKCPDINNKGGVAPLATNCPETCVVHRVTQGWDSYRNAPSSDVNAICPAGYVQLTAYNLQPEYKSANGTWVQLPWPMTTGGLAEAYPGYFYDTTNYACTVHGQYTTTTCINAPANLSGRNSGPLNGGAIAPYTNYGWVSASYDVGYSNYQGNISSGTSPSYNPNSCYADSNCTVQPVQPISWCSSWSGGTPAGCNAFNYGFGWMCLYGSPVCTGYDPWGSCNSYGCTIPCNASSPYMYFWVTRWVYPNICYYKGGNLVPGSGMIPSSLVCGRIKPSWR